MKDVKKKENKPTGKLKDLEKVTEQEESKVRGGSLNTYISKPVGEKQGSKK